MSEQMLDMRAARQASPDLSLSPRPARERGDSQIELSNGATLSWPSSFAEKTAVAPRPSCSLDWLVATVCRPSRGGGRTE